MEIKFSDLYRDTRSTREVVYQQAFLVADSRGHYIELKGKRNVRITKKILYVDDNIIPLVKIILIGMLDKHAVCVEYLNEYNVFVHICFKIDGSSPSDVSKIYSKFEEALEKAISGAEKEYPEIDLKSFRQVAPPDTCVCCGGSGSSRVKFSRVITILVFVFTLHREVVLCKNDLTKRGLANFFTTFFWALPALEF